MNRSAPLKRSPLPRATYAQVLAWNNRERKPLARGKPPKKIGRRALREQAALTLGRAVVIARSGGKCEGPRIVGVHPSYAHGGSHVHHVLSRGRGGSHDPSNLLHACADLHRWIHDNPHEASEIGLLASRPAG